MSPIFSRGIQALLFAVALATSFPSHGQVNDPAGAKPTGRIIVKWKAQALASSPTARAQKASSAAKTTLRIDARSVDTEYEPLTADVTATDELQGIVERLEQLPDVEVAAIEYRRKLYAVPNDPLLMQQWYLLSAQPSATRAEAAWEITQGSPSVVVAVLDTGWLPHPDLEGKVLPGYDFISHDGVANDGDGRDANPLDPGDWVTREEVNASTTDFLDEDCLNEGRDVSSSWHGTRVAGVIAANTNNGIGIAGGGWNTMILPVRVMGKCGGLDRDIIDGMRWAAGLQVGSLPINPDPAKVINLSLGGASACGAAYQSAVNEIIARGVVIVAAAGNEGQQVSAPANCDGVIGVAALRQAGSKVGFSNLGPQITIGAPGGNCVNLTGQCLFPIVTTTNRGVRAPTSFTYTDQLGDRDDSGAPILNVGTSFSAPIVAGAVALLHSVNSSLTPAQASHLLRATATPFPTNPGVRTCTVPNLATPPQLEECNCTTSTCGAGMLNTGAAVAAALRPLAVVRTNGTVAAGATISLDGADSFASQGRTIVAYHWGIDDVTGATPTLANPNNASTTLQIPGESRFTLRLTVTDDEGTQDTRSLAMATMPSPAPTPTPSPPPSNGGSGGGGTLGWELLLLALLAYSARGAQLIGYRL
jgi:serine protease